MRVILLSLISVLLIGCATTGPEMPVATMENLKPGNALIIVKRADSFLGAARSVGVTDGEKVIGRVSNGKSISWQRPAGGMELNLVPSFGMVSKQPPLKQTVAAGKKYTFETFLSGGSFKLKGPR